MSNTISASTLERFTTFGDLLRFLRRRAGITQIELSIAVGYSDAQISRLEQNLRLPDIPTIEARFVPALGLERDPQAVSLLLDLAANVRRENAPGPGLCPYKGLNYFDEADADLFAGREGLTAKIVERIFSLVSSREINGGRFFAIVGSSGSGKSSLIRAGVVPALRWNKASANWPIHIFTPAAHPLESLAGCLAQDAGSVAATAVLMDDLAQDSRSLNLYMKRALRAGEGSLNSSAGHFLLVVDQFEELFALCRSEEERFSFINNLLVAASEANGPAIIVITLRADFYAHCAGYPELRDALSRHQEYIGSMSDDELRRAIEEPAHRGSWELEPGLVELLLHDVGHEPGALPLLSHALLETWQRRRGRTLTLSGYTSSGGVRSAIAETAETVFVDQFTHEQQTIARRIFLRLTELGDETGIGDTRRRASFTELILKPEEAVATQTVLKALADARLITTTEGLAEVAHEALIREWPTLRRWLEDNRDGLRVHRHLTESAQEWLRMGRDSDGLYRGARLAQAREWAAASQAEMNAWEIEFLENSIALSEREVADREAQRKRELEAAQKLAETEKTRADEQAHYARQLRKRAYYLSGAFMIALAMAFIAIFFSSQARKAVIAAQAQQRIATSRELAAAAISNLSVDPERSILLALESVSTTYSIDNTWTSEAEDALHRALLASRIQLTLRGHTGHVLAVAFRPGGKQAATASDDGTAILWDLETGRSLHVLPTHATRDRHNLDFSPDGKFLATAADIGTAKVWDAETGQVLSTLNGHADWVTAVVFSPDGKLLATASEDRSAIIWDSATGQKLFTLIAHTGQVWDVAFSPDGNWLATASEDHRVIIWDVTTGEKLHNILNDAGPVYSVAFSQDGKRIAVASLDSTVRILDAATGSKLLFLEGHTNRVWDVAFSPDGRRLATASLDGRVKIWNTITGQELLTLSGLTGPAEGVAFSPDCIDSSVMLPEECGTLLITANWDGTAKLWNASFSRELLTLSFAGATANAISPDGFQLAIGYSDGVIKTWDLSAAFDKALLHSSFFSMVPSDQQLTLRGPEQAINNIVYSPDGKRLFASGDDHIAIVWDLVSGKELFTLRGADASILGAAFSPDGMLLAVAGADYMVKIWDLGNTNGPVQQTLPIPGWSFNLIFSPDGSKLAAAMEDATAIVWDLETGKELHVLRGHSFAVYGIAFSPDGGQLATASDDGTAMVWDAETGQNLFTLRGHTGWVNGVAFSPDGLRVATGSQDGTAKLWDAATGHELLTLNGHTGDILKLAVNPDNTRLVTVSERDQTIRFYLLQIEDLVALGRAHVTRSLTNQECQQYLHLSPEQCSLDIEFISPTPPMITEAVPASSQVLPSNGKVCELTDLNGLNDQFFNQIAYQGVLASAKQFGWQNAVIEPRLLPEYGSSITKFINFGCDLIVLPTAFSFIDGLKAIAETNPGQKFQVMDWPFEPPLENVRADMYAIDQAAFLAGYVAASVTRSGVVATFGGKIHPGVTIFMDGFARGVDFYNDQNGAQIIVLGWDIDQQEGIFTGNFVSSEDSRLMAEEFIKEGADILLPVTGNAGLGAAAAASEREGVYIIGVDSDWMLTFPEYSDIILTSIEKRLDVSVLSAVKAIDEGKFIGGTYIGTLENGGVGIAPFHNLVSLVSPKVIADMEQIKAGIIAGEIKTGP